MIIRIPHRRRFTMIDNAALKDERLSFRATGVLAYLLSLPDGTEISGRGLVNAKSEGRDAILKSMAELEKAGYLLRERVQRTDGTWSTVVTLSEAPSPDFQASVPGNRTVSSHKPSPEKPSPGFPDLKTLSTNYEVPISADSWESGREPALLDAETRRRGAEFFRALRTGELAEPADESPLDAISHPKRDAG